MEWRNDLARLWFHFKTMSLRGRFFFGKASFVDADIDKTESSFVDAFDENGRALGRRMLSHYHLATRMPRTGSQGWDLYVETFAPEHDRQPVALQCSTCGHVFVIRIHAESDPLAAGAALDKPLGTPVSYVSKWFSFMAARGSGQPTLSCTHCEQAGPPRVIRHS